MMCSGPLLTCCSLAGALHLTHLDSVQQLRPSMHYLDGLDAIDKAEKKRNATNAGDDEGGSGASDSESGAAPSSSSAKADTAAARRKGALQVSATMGAKSADGKDNIMQAQREAEAENWVELEWLNEEVSFCLSVRGRTHLLTRVSRIHSPKNRKRLSTLNSLLRPNNRLYAPPRCASSCSRRNIRIHSGFGREVRIKKR